MEALPRLPPPGLDNSRGMTILARMSIPRILHQMWRDEALPERWQRFRETWLHFHPTWEHRLWTDASLREFVAAHYPDFLPVYEAYPLGIMRSDAGRYLLLQHFGGVYADLDTECLRAHEPLLEGERLLLPLEPGHHLQGKMVMASGRRRIVGNAWMASEPGHPFWQVVQEELLGRRKLPGALEATGPFLLSQAVDHCDDAQWRPRILPSEVVQPASNLDPDWLAAREPGSPHWHGPGTYALHYWDGSWWKHKRPQTKVFLLTGAQPLIGGVLDEGLTARLAASSEIQPLVSCLMVTGQRRDLAALAILAFRRQTYENRELVVIDDSGLELPAEVRADDDGGRIRWISLPPENKPLGTLRNLALAEARGELLCQWDDDDLSAPGRLERQAHAFRASGADACGLHRVQLWWPAQDRFALSPTRIWECALMWRRGAITAYPELRSGEDTPPVLALAAKGRVLVMDAPQLYTYVCHGRNTFSAEHWEKLWTGGSHWLEGAECRVKLRIMQPAIPLNEYLGALGLPTLLDEFRDPQAVAPAPAAVAPAIPIAAKPALEWPKIMVATPLKDAAPFLENFFSNLALTDYPLDKITVALLESDSRDATPALARELLGNYAKRLAGTRFIKRDFGFEIQGDRSRTGLQRQRRSILARSRNLLVETALQDEEWVLWIDADVQSWPTDIVRRLLATGRSIVTPHCVKGVRSGPSFDTNSFVFRDPELRDGPGHLVDGLQQPPRGETRLYLDSFRDRDEVRLDSVGGTMLLVQADLHRDGLRFPARPYRGFIETEGLAQMAREFGVDCWGLPRVEIIHP